MPTENILVVKDNVRESKSLESNLLTHLTFRTARTPPFMHVDNTRTLENPFTK